MINSSQLNVGTVVAATISVSVTIISVAQNYSTVALAPFFYLATLSQQRFIHENDPVMFDETLAEELFLVTEAWTQLDFLCKKYILSCL